MKDARAFGDVKKWLSEVLPNFPAYSHLIGNFDVVTDTRDARVLQFGLKLIF